MEFASCSNSEEMLSGAQNSAPSYLLGLGWPGEKSRVMAEGVQLHLFIMWPHYVLETHGFLWVIGDMSGYPDKRPS